MPRNEVRVSRLEKPLRPFRSPWPEQSGRLSAGVLTAYKAVPHGSTAFLQRAARAALWLCGLAVMLLGAVGCGDVFTDILDGFVASFGETVPGDPTDTSSPEVTLTFPDHTDGRGEIVLREGDPPRTVRVSDLRLTFFFVIGSAEDSQGVKSICLQPSETYTCCEDSICTEPEPGGMLPTCLGWEEISDGTSASTRLWVPYPLHRRRLDNCNEHEMSRRLFSLTVTGENFGGQSVTVGPVIFEDP